MRKNIITPQNFQTFLQKNKDSDDLLRKSTPLFKSPIPNNSFFNRPFNKISDTSLKQQITDQILRSVRLESYFQPSNNSESFKNSRITLESRLDRIEKKLGFQIYRLIYDLHAFTKALVDSKKPEIAVDTERYDEIVERKSQKCEETPVLLKNTQIIEQNERENSNGKCLNSVLKEKHFEKASPFTDTSKEEYFKTLHNCIQKAEASSCLQQLYDNAISIFMKLPQNMPNSILNMETTPKKPQTQPKSQKNEPISILKSLISPNSTQNSTNSFISPGKPPKQQKSGSLIHSQSVTWSPKKTYDEFDMQTPEKKSKKVSFHEEVIVQIFSPVGAKSEIVKTVKKEEYKERKKKGAVSFLDFQKKIDETEKKRNEGTRNLLSFINKNDLGRMDSLNFLQNSWDSIGKTKDFSKGEKITTSEKNTDSKQEKITEIEKNGVSGKNEAKFNRETGRRSNF